MKTVLERFLKYVQIDTESAPDRDFMPSTEKQKNLSRLLMEELKEIGVADARTDDYGYVYATIPATAETKAPVLGFIAHMDTSPAVSGKDVKPIVHRSYNGGDLVLNEKLGITLSSAQYPKLKKLIGQDIVTSDGTTLLGADDKSGVAEIMAMAETLMANPQIPHGVIKVAFTPDEEVGKGVDLFDVKGFGADYAYTLDGGELGELEYENFNAAGAKLTINGRSIHPGASKNQMKNALLMAMEFQSMLPVEQNPMYTEKYEGFFHLDTLSGTVEQCRADYIIRDHDRAKFEEKKARFEKIAAYLNEKYGENAFVVEMKDSYYNMREQIEPHFHLIENAKQAMEALDIEPIIIPVRGGTDGSRLSYMGLPCPNLCAGGQNAHGRFEYVSVQSMERSVEIILQIIEIYTKG